ncbi:MAG: aminopeptidase P family protein [Haloferacaceae archaeon]
MAPPGERRTRAARERLRECGAAALVCAPGPNVRYLSGYAGEPSERHCLLVVPAEGAPTFVVPELVAADVRDATWIDDVRAWRDDEDPTALVERVVAERDLDGERILLDDRMWARFVLDVQAAAPDAAFGLASEVLGPLRRRKDDAELHALRAAARAADAVVDRLRDRGSAVVGLTETELARRIERWLADEGGEGSPFEPVVAAGENGARPHHAHGDREIRGGDPVVLDFGTLVDGYPSDQTRTLVFAGDPPEGFVAVHETVREAQAAGVAAVEPGATAGEVDRATRAVIEAAGYGDEFVHRTGHGVGLEIHEEPFVAAGSDVRLEPGMVFSVEPGIYLDGRFGVRIEDLVVVTADGAERLNATDRGWDARD